VRQIEIHPEVYDELEQARSRYEAQTAGLGNDFLDEVERAINAAQRAPEA